MRLRNRSIAELTPGQTPGQTPRRPSSQARTHTPVQQDEERTGPHCQSPDGDDDDDDDSDVPTATRCPVLRGRGRKRPPAFADREDFKTPVNARRPRVLSDLDPSSPRNAALRHLYSPAVRFLTPTKENSRTPSSDVVMSSPETSVFGLLAGEEDHDEGFDPFTFIQNIPSKSKQPKACARDIPPKTRSSPEATLVLDLDETLMFSSLNVIEGAEYTFHTSFQDHEYKGYMILRPHVKEFLQAMAKVFEMFVYTSAKKEYAEKILDIMDQKRKLFRNRLYQEDCSCVLGHYVKDLGVLQRDLAKTVVLDNAPHTYPYHLMNTIPITSWSGDEEDRELLKLIPYLEKLSRADDFREVLKRRTDHFHRLLSEH